MQPLLDVTAKAIVITGGTRGIGLAWHAGWLRRGPQRYPADGGIPTTA